MFPETKGPVSVAVKIRLLRVGKAKQPSYRVVVADARSPRDGRIIETIGHYGPRAEPSTVDINPERALAWLRQGAQPTEQVQKLLTTLGIWSTFESEKGHPIVTKLNRRGFTTGKVAAPTKSAAPATAAPEQPAAAAKAAPEKPAAPIKTEPEPTAAAAPEAPAATSEEPEPEAASPADTEPAASAESEEKPS